MLAYTSWVVGLPGHLRAQPVRRAAADAARRRGNDSRRTSSPRGRPTGRSSRSRPPRSGDRDIYVVNRDGTGLRNLTNSPRGTDNAPTWSPTGAQIAFTSDRTRQQSDLRDQRRRHRAASSSRSAARAAIARRGRRVNVIAYTRGRRAGPRHRAARPVEQPDACRLTDGVRARTSSPTFAPNGRHIAFVTTRWGKEQIAIVDITGRRDSIRRVTESGNNRYPNWSPHPGGQ